MQTVDEKKMNPSYSEIAGRAYRIWEGEGRPDGCAPRHWVEAEAQLMAAKSRPSAEEKKAGTTQPSQRSRYGLVLKGESAASRA